MTTLAFLPLGLPASDPFWTDADQPWTSVKAWGEMEFPIDHRWGIQSGHGIYINLLNICNNEIFYYYY